MLQLTLGGLSLTLDKFTDGKLPRTTVEPFAGLEYSIYGTSIGDGPFFEPKFIWVATALVDRTQERLVRAINAEFDQLRRNRQSADVLLYDTNEEYSEKLPRTRALVPGYTAIPVGATHTSYFAQFKVWIVRPPEFNEQGRLRTVTLTLQESVKVGT